MLRMIRLTVKIVVFSMIVLVLGNWLHWRGKTISDQVKLQMSHAERTNLFGTVREWAEKLTNDAQKGFRKTFRQSELLQAPQQEEISPSEKQKLKALIRELNSSHR